MTDFQNENVKTNKISVADVEIDETKVKVDFQLLDKYQQYSSELLKISLAGIAVFGFLVQHLNLKNAEDWLKFLVGIGIILLAVSSVCSLRHRYWSSDSMAYFINYLRVEIKLEKAEYSANQYLINRRKKELDCFHELLKKSDLFLRMAIWFLISGILLLAFGVFKLLLVY